MEGIMKEYNDEYIEFMNDPNNSHNCTKCPENAGFDPWPGNRLPCGQFNCWVELHCCNDEEEEE